MNMYAFFFQNFLKLQTMIFDFFKITTILWAHFPYCIYCLILFFLIVYNHTWPLISGDGGRVRGTVIQDREGTYDSVLQGVIGVHVPGDQPTKIESRPH